jgi:outer membrane protein TolC
MKTTTAVLLLLLSLLPALRAEPSVPLTLDGTLQAVLQRHPTIAAAQAAVDAARGRTEQSGSARLPQVSAEAAYTYLSLRPYVEFDLPSGPSSLYETIQNSYNASLTVRQLLSDFGRTDALVAMAKAGELSAKDALEQARSQLGYETIQSFYGTLLLRQAVGVADEEIRALDEARRIAEKRQAGGTATRFDVLTTDVRLANARNSRTSTVAALARRESVLRRLLGLAPGSPLGLSGDFDGAVPIPDMPSAIAEGLRDRPEARLARDARSAAGSRLDEADRERRPVLAATAAGGVQDAQLPSMYSNKGYVDAGVNVSVPLFTGNRIEGRRMEARADERAAQARVDEIERVVMADVEDAFTDLDAARSRLATADTLVAQAQEALALARSRYTNGVITNFELLDAQSAARAAELTRLQARYDCIIASHAVARAAGRPPSAP